MKIRPEYPLTVFYDASCPMCVSEMHGMRDRAGAERLQLVDCSAHDFDDAPFRAEGFPRSAMMARIHARDAGGRWLSGPDAFDAIYRAAGFPALARVWGSPGLRPLLDPLYGWIARNRQLLSRLGLDRAVRALMRR